MQLDKFKPGIGGELWLDTACVIYEATFIDPISQPRQLHQDQSRGGDSNQGEHESNYDWVSFRSHVGPGKFRLACLIFSLLW